VSAFDEDLERLADIADRILAGEPIETFELGDGERGFVLGYTRGAVNDAPARELPATSVGATCPRCLLKGEFDVCPRCHEEGITVTYEDCCRIASGLLPCAGVPLLQLAAAKRRPMTLGDWLDSERGRLRGT
jgi:hypothetical protein